MIADLKADSERWEAERRAATDPGQLYLDRLFRRSSPIFEYRGSATYQSRRCYERRESAPIAQTGYPGAASAAISQGVYETHSYGEPSVSYQRGSDDLHPSLPRDPYYGRGEYHNLPCL
jgi:hypothetical protein